MRRKPCRALPLRRKLPLLGSKNGKNRGKSGGRNGPPSRESPDRSVLEGRPNRSNLSNNGNSRPGLTDRRSKRLHLLQSRPWKRRFGCFKKSSAELGETKPAS